MNVMNYKGYSARIEYSDEDGCFIGHLAGIRDVVGFHGESVAELKAAFEDAVEDYLATCKKLKRTPQRPYSGKVMLRIDPGIHAKAAMIAEAEGKSLNAWAQEALSKAISAQ
jgi:predicted HicB family RNase H-like nuclease